MVNSDKGITNLHVPSDVIVDASMPAMIRTSGQMWNSDNKLQDTIALIRIAVTLAFMRPLLNFVKNGALTHNNGKCSKRRFDGTKAEEYGSHDKTFQMTADGVVRVTDTEGNVLMEQPVEEKDISECVRSKTLIQDWVKLAVNRARATNVPTILVRRKQST
jgi:isocitrate dehydrogenase